MPVFDRRSLQEFYQRRANRRVTEQVEVPKVAPGEVAFWKKPDDDTVRLIVSPDGNKKYAIQLVEVT